MSARAAHLLLTLGLLVLVGATPFPVHFVNQLHAAETALEAYQPELAIPQLRAALSYEPGLAGLNLELIEAALQAGQPDVALLIVQAMPETERKSPQVYCYRARAAVQLADWQTAVAAVDEAGPECAQTLNGLELLAASLTQSGQFPAAIELLSALTERQPGNASLQAQLGLLLAVSRPEQALSRLTLAEQLDPHLQLPPGLFDTVTLGLEQGRPAYTLAQVGQTLARAGDWALAAEAFRSALDIDPSYTEALAYYGLALDRSGGNGLKQLEQAVGQAPQAALPLQLLGKHWRINRDPARALEAFEAAAALAPDDPILASDLGAAYAAVGDLPAAEAAFVHAAELAPADPVMWQLLAQFTVDYEVKLAELGIPAARRAVAIQPDSASALDLLGYAYYLNGDWQLAERFLMRATETDPQLAAAHYHIGLLQISRGELADGRRALALARSLDPEGRVGALAQRSLENLP